MPVAGIGSEREGVFYCAQRALIVDFGDSSGGVIRSSPIVLSLRGAPSASAAARRALERGVSPLLGAPVLFDLPKDRYLQPELPRYAPVCVSRPQRSS